MSELDGVWSVKRVSGMLPPLLGVEKRISGDRGETSLGGLPGAAFTVEGLSLRYLPPLAGLVDHLERDGEAYSGSATFRGREYGRFMLTPAGRRSQPGHEERPVDERLTLQLVKHLDEAVAMEQGVARMLDGMIATTQDGATEEDLRRHRREAEEQAARLRGRLAAHGSSPSRVREAGGVLGALLKVPVDMIRGGQAGRNARDAYAAAHMEIASYQLLERVAIKAGDEETAAVARLNRSEEEAAAGRIAASWDRVAELVLAESGLATEPVDH